MPTRPELRRNYPVLLIVVACIALIGADRLWSVPLLRSLTAQLWMWVIMLAACAALLGAVNVIVVHLRRVVEGTRSWVNSLILVATGLAVFVMGLLGAEGSSGPFAEWVFEHLLSPGMATLFAMLAFFTVAAAYRYLRIRFDTPAPARSVTGGEHRADNHTGQGGGWMLAGAALFLLLQMPMLNALLPPAAAGFAGWILDVPAMATLRGVLLGGSIALIVIGARLVLTGK